MYQWKVCHSLVRGPDRTDHSVRKSGQEETKMNHPTTMGLLSQARHQDLLRETAGTWRVDRSSGGTSVRMQRIAGHPRLVTAAVALVLAFGLVIA